MELPPDLRQAVDAVLAGTPLGALREAADRLSARYRAELRDGRLHLSAELAVKAYLAARLPATYAATRASLAAAAQARPDFSPTSLLDVGAGPGSALWAAHECWPGLEAATLLEAGDAVRRMGEILAEGRLSVRAEWIAGDAGKDLGALAPADLVTLAYVLDELPPASIGPLALKLWALTKDVLVVVEPGTPAGWRRILEVRAVLIGAGAHILAPCPHAEACPLAAPDWCHFAERVARSRLHRMTKRGEVPWEDEKSIFIAASRTPGVLPEARVLAPPRKASGRIDLKLCLAAGGSANATVTRRDGETYRRARRLGWGDALMPEPEEGP